MSECTGASDHMGDPEEPEYTEITVVAKGQTFLHVTPSCLVFKATLQEVKLQQDDGHGNVYVFDVFTNL